LPASTVLKNHLEDTRMPYQATSRGSKVAIWAPALAAILIFFADAGTSRGVVLCTAYIPLIYFGLKFSEARIVFLYAFIASFMTMFGAFLKHPSSVTIWMLLTNRLVNIAVIWWTAEQLFQHRAIKDAFAQQELLAARQEVAGKDALIATIVDSSDEAIISKSLDGTIKSWNRGAERLFGYREQEAIGKPISMLIPFDLRQEEDRILIEMVHGRSIEHFETVRTHKNGSRIEVSITVSPIKDIHGKVVGASKNLREVGRRKGTEAMLAAVVNNAIDGLITIDDAGNIETFNHACQMMFGYVEGEVIGKNINMLLPERYYSEHAGYFADVHRNGVETSNGTTGKEVSGRRKDGTVFPADLSVSAFQLAGARHFSGIIRDITEKKRAEEEAASYTRALVRSNQALDEFAYAASHDLKAPLRVIDNTSKWLEEDLAEHLTDEMRENMQMLRGRVKRMDKLLNDLLAYSRIGRKTDAEFSEIVPGSALMADVLTMVSPPAGFSIMVDPAFDDLPVCRMPLQQILMNLISNAIKHHDRKTGRIEVLVDPGEKMHTFMVKDDGPGIDARFHARIFDMFQTLKPRDQVEGSGMGLAMVRKNIEVFGGTIAVESEGRGSTFRFTWPAQQPDIEQTVGISTLGVAV
jgi:two-component system sensor kinase FixL